MTSNPQYNLSKLPTGSEGERIYKALYERLVELSNQPWQHWLGMQKQNGFETIDYHDLKFQPNQNITLTKDTKLYVARFDTHKTQGGRIIGFKQSPCAAFHIIGYDIKFSAYSH